MLIRFIVVLLPSSSPMKVIQVAPDPVPDTLTKFEQVQNTYICLILTERTFLTLRKRLSKNTRA